MDVLKRNIKYVGEVLCKHIYSFHGEELDIFNSSLSIDKNFLETQLESLTSTTRFFPFLTAEDDLVRGLESTLQRYVDDVSLKKHKISSKELRYEFHEGKQMVLNVYRTKSLLFDLIMAVFVAFYLTSLFIFVHVIRGQRIPKSFLFLKNLPFFDQHLKFD